VLLGVLVLWFVCVCVDVGFWWGGGGGGGGGGEHIHVDCILKHVKNTILPANVTRYPQPVDL